MLVVSDGSTDRTAERGARGRASHVAVLPFNLGIGGALRTGFAFAVRRGYERAVQFDADGQHDPLAVRVLLDGLDRGADMVIGSRFAEGGAVTYEVSGIRRRAMKVLQWLVRVLVRQRFTDTSSGFRAFSRPMLEYFAQTYPVEYMDSVEALVQACNAGFRVDEVPANMRGRAGRCAQSPGNFKLVYYYVRLLVVLLVVDHQPRASAPGAPRRRDDTSGRHERERHEHRSARPHHRARGGGDRVHHPPRAQPAAAGEVLGALVLDRPRARGARDLPRPARVALRPRRDRATRRPRSCCWR